MVVAPSNRSRIVVLNTIYASFNIYNFISRFTNFIVASKYAKITLINTTQQQKEKEKEKQELRLMFGY